MPLSDHGVLSWQQFGDAVALLAVRTRSRDLTGVYGVPVADSVLRWPESALDVRLRSPEPDALVVDDVYETGRTLETLRLQFPQHPSQFWVSKTPPLWWHAAGGGRLVVALPGKMPIKRWLMSRPNVSRRCS